MNYEELSTLINQLFDKGDNKRGLEQLREFNGGEHKTAASLNRQAVIEEQIGDWHLAGKAHYGCIELAPHIASSYLYAGSWLHNSRRFDAAAAAYSLANEADPKLLSPSSSPQSVDAGATSLDGRQQRLAMASSLLRRYLSAHHRQTMREVDSSKRLKESVWVQTHDSSISLQDANYRPQLFYIPQLPTKRYFHSSDLPWATAFIKCFEKIKSELTSAITEGSELRPYLGSGDAIPTNLSTLAGSLNWAALDLYKNGELQTAAKSLFPNTLAAFEDVPTYQLTNSPYEIFFSLLKPGQTIAPHYGQSNHSLTAHLALDIPDSCYLEVDHEQRIWREGELMVFDDNYLHSAHNASDKTRIVLIFSIWNPDLSAVERAAIRHAFKSRQQWMLSRREKLNQLLITN